LALFLRQNSLVDDVFGKDTMGKVQMEKVVMLIWQFRDDANVIQFMAQFVAKVSICCLDLLVFFASMTEAFQR
jgi:hypothetical protein